MHLLDHSFDSPAENLALDEVLLDAAETGRSGEILRFWESPSHFVVLGLSQSVRDHVIEAACEADGVPILRRCSAGGCVLQGPGCLDYSLVLSSAREGCATIHGSYRTILAMITSALHNAGCEVEPAGTSDLAMRGRKISGSAQRRRKRFFLHHGTLLFAFNISLCQKYLKEPAERPDYRAKRAHSEFLANIPITRSRAIKNVSEVFHVCEPTELAQFEADSARELAANKYVTIAWTCRK